MALRPLNSFSFPLLQPLTFDLQGQIWPPSPLQSIRLSVPNGGSIFVFNPPLISHLFCFNLSLAITPGGGVALWPWWVMVRGGGGATNLRLTPKAVSDALGALGRQPARSPWIGGRTRRRHTNTKICACRNQSGRTEKISPLPPHTNKRTHAYTLTAQTLRLSLCTLSSSHTHTRLLSPSETQLIF